MKTDTVKNISWGFLGGWVAFLYFVCTGVLYAFTVVGIKKAYACFKFALYALAPFGVGVHVNYFSHGVSNTFWVLTAGWQICLYCLLAAGFWYLTYFGRYLGNRWFCLAQFVLAPFGAKFWRAVASYPVLLPVERL